MEAIFMGAITWAIIGICYMIYSDFKEVIKCLIEDYFKPHQGGYSYSR